MLLRSMHTQQCAIRLNQDHGMYHRPTHYRWADQSRHWNRASIFRRLGAAANAETKTKGEKRILKRLPDDPLTTWAEWKKNPTTLSDDFRARAPGEAHGSLTVVVLWEFAS